MIAPISRNVRPRATEYDDQSDNSVEASDDERGDIGNDENADLSTEEDKSVVDEALDGIDYESRVSNVSFGALKQAQDALSRKRKRGSESTADQEDKLKGLRARLRQIKEQKKEDPSSALAGKTQIGQSQRGRSSKHSNIEQNDSDESDQPASDSDSAPSEEGASSKARTSKHAPTAQSSKRQVTRKRIVVDVPKRVVRDPRYDALSQKSIHPDNSEKAYSFLRDYQKAEIAELKAAMKKTKDEDEKELLKRKAGSMENRLKAKEAKERQQDIIRKHRKEEREKIQQGKTPYYLKKKDIKEKALVEKFQGMKSKEREKAIEKKRRKEGQKEKKRMPDARRMAG